MHLCMLFIFLVNEITDLKCPTSLQSHSAFCDEETFKRTAGAGEVGGFPENGVSTAVEPAPPRQLISFPQNAIHFHWAINREDMIAPELNPDI